MKSKRYWNRMFLIFGTLAMIILKLVWPPVDSPAQTQLPSAVKHQPDPINQTVKETIKDIIQNAEAVDGAAEKPDKQATRQAEKKIVYVPVIKERKVVVHDTVTEYRDSIFVHNGVGVEKPIIIYKAPPVYPGTPPRGASEFEKKQQQGIWKKLFKRRK